MRNVKDPVVPHYNNVAPDGLVLSDVITAGRNGHRYRLSNLKQEVTSGLDVKFDPVHNITLTYSYTYMHKEIYSRKRKINSDQYSLSWVLVCTSVPCGQNLDQTRWQDGKSRCRPGNKQFVLQNQWGRLSTVLSQDRPSRSWLASKTPTVCTSHLKPPQESRDRDWRVPLRTDYMLSLIWFAALLPLTAVTILSVVRLDSSQGTVSDSRHWISLATTTYPERFLSTFYTIPNVKLGILPHLKWKLLTIYCWSLR